MTSRGDAETRRRTAASVLLPVALAASALLVARPAPAQHRVVGRDAETAARLLRLEDRREYDSAFIASALASPSAEVRRRAVLAAGRIGDRHATSAVAARLADPDTAVAASAAFALGLLRDTTAVSALAAQVRTGEITRRPTVIGEAALALGKMPTAGGKGTVEGFLAGAPPRGAGVQRAVGEALLAVWRFPRPMNVAAVAKWLSSPDPELRWRAAYALSRRADPQATTALARVATDADPLVRSFAMRGLGAAMADSSGVGRAAALRLVLAGTADRDHAVSVNAVRTLGGYDAPEAISRLVELLRGGDAYLAITAAESLARLGAKAPAAAAPLRAVAEDASKPVFLRTTALASLAEADPASAVHVADAFMREPGWRYRSAAARVYANAAAKADYVSSPVRPKLEAAARDPDGRVATAVLEAAVGAAGDSAARIRPLLEMGLQSPDFYARVNAIG
ncbi:MAG: HEAT repeat domain-containing protein, partial [Gemmatimonadetes bacterium]|nr:HEAT repeat domain-containing protein [Gemmatimonadota bacterium]